MPPREAVLELLVVDGGLLAPLPPDDPPDDPDPKEEPVDVAEALELLDADDDEPTRELDGPLDDDEEEAEELTAGAKPAS